MPWNLSPRAVSKAVMLLAAAAMLAVPCHADWDYDVHTLHGWRVSVRRDFPASDKKRLPHALVVLGAQLSRIEKAVPEPALSRLKEFPIFVSPPYAGFPEGCAYHPAAQWLEEHGRDPAMAGGVECTLVRIIDNEDYRMPYFVLHELAHGYMDRFLGNEDADIKEAYEAAKAGGAYERVERVNWPGQPHGYGRAYAMENEREYFAESTEAFFGRNDFFPFTRADLRKADPRMERLLREKWGLGR